MFRTHLPLLEVREEPEGEESFDEIDSTYATAMEMEFAKMKSASNKSFEEDDEDDDSDEEGEEDDNNNESEQKHEIGSSDSVELATESLELGTDSVSTRSMRTIEMVDDPIYNPKNSALLSFVCMGGTYYSVDQVDEVSKNLDAR